jgi:hypothetical protein
VSLYGMAGLLPLEFILSFRFNGPSSVDYMPDSISGHEGPVNPASMAGVTRKV